MFVIFIILVQKQQNHAILNRTLLRTELGLLKNVTNRLMDRTEAPDWLWLRASIYVAMLLNVIAHR